MVEAMSKIAVVYWSGTGNTEAMAKAVLEGVTEKGVEAVLFLSLIHIYGLRRRDTGVH